MMGFKGGPLGDGGGWSDDSFGLGGGGRSFGGFGFGGELQRCETRSWEVSISTSSIDK